MSDNNSEQEQNVSSDETVSYSEEEILDMEIDNAEQLDELHEEEHMIEDILDENERLEQAEEAFLKSKRNGKQKAPKPTAMPDIERDMWKEINRLQSQLNALKPGKRSRQEDESPKNSRRENVTKKQKVDLNVSVENVNAYDRPGSSRTVENKQLSSAKQKQLSTATASQLSSGKTKQLSVSAESNQLSSRPTHTVTKPMDLNTVVLDEKDEEDPLRAETEEIQRTGDLADPDVNEDLSSDDEMLDEPGIFADLVDNVSIEGESDRPGPPLLQVWADKLNLAWKNKIGKTAYTHLLQKYKTPSNLDALKVPAVNKEIWKPLNKWQKKADLNMAACQRSLITVVSAVMKLHDLVSSLPRASRQIAAQTSADIVSLVGKVNREMMVRRKIAARSALVGDYKTLATTIEASEANLFGDHLTQDIKDVNIRRKISDPNTYNYRGYRGSWRGNRGYSSISNNYNNNNSFLWRGRGRGRGNNRASHHTRYQSGPNQYQKKQH